MVALHAKYEPKRFDEVVGQDKALRKLQCLRDTVGLDGQVISITGESGTGKTTLARLIANKVADDFAIEEYDAMDVTRDVIREWQRKAQCKPLFGAGYAFIVNETASLSNDAVSRLQTTLDDKNVQRFSTWVFTMTTEGQARLFGSRFDSFPFLSRAVPIELESDDDSLIAMAQRVMEIAQSENVDGQPLSAYMDLMRECKSNMRSALQRVASGYMLGL